MSHIGSSRRQVAGSWSARTMPVVPPIYQSVTYQLDERSYEDIQQRGGLKETWYGRFGNPTVGAAAEAINSSHFSLSPDERLAAGILPGMLRLSVGVEEPSDLLDDLEQALEST